MRLGYVILHVADVVKTLKFYQEAFGLEVKMLHESEHYGEMETGQTSLAFVSLAMMETLVKGYPTSNMNPQGYEIVLVTDQVEQAYNHALSCGAEAVLPPIEKPWGQRIAYVRDINGGLVELATPMN